MKNKKSTQEAGHIMKAIQDRVNAQIISIKFKIL